MSGLEFLKQMQSITLTKADRKVVDKILKCRPDSRMSDHAIYVINTLRHEFLSRGVRYI